MLCWCIILAPIWIQTTAYSKIFNWDGENWALSSWHVDDGAIGTEKHAISQNVNGLCEMVRCHSENIAVLKSKNHAHSLFPPSINFCLVCNLKQGERYTLHSIFNWFDRVHSFIELKRKYRESERIERRYTKDVDYDDDETFVATPQAEMLHRTHTTQKMQNRPIWCSFDWKPRISIP